MMIHKIVKHSKKISLILGAISVLSLPPYYQLYSLFLGISGILYLLQLNQNNEKKYKKAFAIGYWFGFSFFAIGFSWAANALLVDIATSGWLYPFALIAFGSFFGLFIAIPVMFTAKFDCPYRKVFVLASSWTILEWLRSFIFTGFPWNLIGTTLAFDIKTIQLANILGTYGLSYVILILAGLPFIFITKKDKKSLLFISILIICFVSTFYFYGTYSLKQRPITNNKQSKIRIVQPSIPQSLKWNEIAIEENFQTYIDMSNQDGIEDIDLVIWGETASPFPLNLSSKHLNQITSAIPTNGLLVTGSIRYQINFETMEYRPANSLFVINKNGDILDSYNKTHLVPFGEYIPLKEYLPNFIKPVTQMIGDFIKGTGNRSIALENNPSFGPLICYEIIFPGKIINKKDRPEWLINITNDGWYGNSMGPHQHLVNTRMRAIEEGITIARVANTGISALISSKGEIIKSLGLNETNILDVNLPKSLNSETFYSKYGNFSILILSVSNIILALFIRRRNI